MRTGRTPHPDPTLSSRPSASNEQFQWMQDDQGHAMLVHQGMNRAARQEQKAIRKKAFKNALNRLQKNARKAEKTLAARGAVPTSQDVSTEPEVGDEPGLPPEEG